MEGIFFTRVKGKFGPWGHQFRFITRWKNLVPPQVNTLFNPWTTLGAFYQASTPSRLKTGPEILKKFILIPGLKFPDF